MYSETQYNYLDFDSRTFVRVCRKDADDKVVLLDAPETVDVSAHLPKDAGFITVVSSGHIVTEMSENLETMAQIMCDMTYLVKI